MKEEKRKKSFLATSIARSAVAFVFLVIGYQTALFVHKASIMRIISNRDAPDTVYVYAGANSSQSREIKKNLHEEPASHVKKPACHIKEPASYIDKPAKYVKKPAKHSSEASMVAATYSPKKEVENFKFNPNTVAIDDLIRLGFSVKQAQSIDNYRKKGGRFRRKSDFAHSYVVSDSVYNRLESYIDIPLININTADSAQLVSLPGIGKYFAQKILEYREKLCGFSYKEQLMDIYHFDKDKFERLEDLIVIGNKAYPPYPLWTLPEEELRKHPYILSYAAHGIVMFRTHNPKEKWTVEELSKAGILREDLAPKLLRCRIERVE